MSSRHAPSVVLSSGIIPVTMEYLFFRLFVENFEHLDCRQRNAGAGAEDCSDTCLVEEIVVLSGNNAAGRYEDILAAEFLEFFDNLRDKCLVACGE